MDVAVKNRDASIELYRLTMMFCICWLHCTQQGGRFSETRWIYYLTRFSVVGFVFISGYFGIGCSWRKIFRIVVISVWGAAFSVSLLRLTSSTRAWHMLVPDVAFSVVGGYWFLWAYIALMVLSPILNRAVDCDVKATCVRSLPCLMLVFGWSYATQLPGVMEYVPTAVGFGPTSALTFSAIYVFARIVRLCKLDEWMSWWKSLVVAVVSVPFCCVGLSHYNSIFSLAFAFAVFCLLRKLSISGTWGRLVNFLSPSMLSVYVLHQCCRGFSFVRFGMSTADMAEKCPVLQTFLAAVVVFVACVIIDLIFRRGITALFERIKKV